jgi:hypothetical protein
MISYSNRTFLVTILNYDGVKLNHIIFFAHKYIIRHSLSIWLINILDSSFRLIHQASSTHLTMPLQFAPSSSRYQPNTKEDAYNAESD